MPTSPSTITALPTPPSTSDPTNFDTRADALLGALPTMVTETNAAGATTHANAVEAAASATTASAASLAAISATGYAATSTTSLSVGTGSKAFTTQAGKSFAASGDRVTAISKGTPNARMRGTATYSGTTLTITVDEYTGSGTYTDWILVISALEALPATGKQAIYIPSGALVPRITNGPSLGSVETTTNKVMLATLDFDASTKEYAQFAMRMPKAWNEGTVTAVFEWSHASTTTNFKVAWAIQAVAISDDDAGDAAFGTAIQTNDTGGTTNDLYASPETTAVTVAGSPAAEDWVVFQVYRVADDATNDTLAVDARLHGITLFITTDAGNDA